MVGLWKLNSSLPHVDNDLDYANLMFYMGISLSLILPFYNFWTNLVRLGIFFIFTLVWVFGYKNYRELKLESLDQNRTPSITSEGGLIHKIKNPTELHSQEVETQYTWIKMLLLVFDLLIMYFLIIRSVNLVLTLVLSFMFLGSLFFMYPDVRKNLEEELRLERLWLQRNNLATTDS